MRTIPIAVLCALLLACSDPGPPVVFIGDSITMRLMKRCKGASFESAAVSGQTSVQMLARFQSDVLDRHPATVVINAGTNDILRTRSPNTDSIARMAQIATEAGARVIIGLVPPNEDWKPPNLINDPVAGRAEIRRFNESLRAIAERGGYQIADYYTAFTLADGSQNPELFDDGTHQTKEGVRVQCAVVQAALQKLTVPSTRQ